jgi:hypothetical protein
MPRQTPLPGQRSLFRPEPADVLASLRQWDDADLLHLVRAGAYELIRRDLPLPVAVPVVEAAYGIDVSVPV